MTDQETLGVRLAKENTLLRDEARLAYMARRRMEEAIRKHAEGQCDCPSPRVCVVKLYRLIPLNTRPVWHARAPQKS